MITYDIDKKQPKKSKKNDFRSEIKDIFKRPNRAYFYLSVFLFKIKGA
ncbi:hypothetical protein FNE27_06590 [Helicobacter pylori]|nr:hypothetical protein FNE27_04250 [Helicobacter pylori]WRG14826.1 hypothetical protein FNE27_06590 [Helicobacter pylori]